MKITLKVKRWSSSNVLVPPKKELENEGIHPGDLVDVTIEKKAYTRNHQSDPDK
jgi:antitoxin component of MazEF toxin-antitoxin module